MKKSPLVLSIIGALLTIASAVLLILLPQIGGELSGFMTMTGFRSNLLHAFLPALKGTMLFGVGQPIFSGIFVGLLCLVVVFWLWHFIMLCATRRANSLSINLFWLIFGFVDVCIFLAFAGYSEPDVGYVFVGTFNGNAFTNGFSLIGLLFADGLWNHIGSILLLVGILALATAGLVISLISVIGAIHDDRTEPNYKEEEEDEVQEIASEGSPAEIETNKVEEAKAEETKDASKQNAPLIIQNITYSAPNQTPAPQVTPAKEEKKEKPLTEDDVRRILIDALTSSQKALQAEKKEEEKPAPQPAPAPMKVEEKKEPTPVEERPLTAKELRAIIKNELRDHDHPEELLPLTDEQCRALIRDELDEYYASTRPQNEKVEEEKAPETQNDNFEEDFMTADELSKMIRNEVVSVLAEKPAEEKLTLEMVRNAIKEELASQEKPVIPSKEEIVSSVKEELAPNEESEKKQNELILSIKEQAFKAEYEAKLEAAKNEAAIERVKNSQLTADDIRSIISSELDKRLASLEAKKEEPTPKEEVIASIAPKEEVVVAAPKEESEEEKAERLPFATRLLNLDDDMKEFYNILKEEALSYGLKSRLSISGDTFRLHTKTYLKIVVAGKGLKLYMALDPHDYKDSSIPVKDAGVKNLYKDIPLVFKVRSPLSLRRAKQLIKDVCEKDNLKKEEITHFNYVAQLTSYKVAGTEEDED